MIMKGLTTELEVNEKRYRIRSDYRDILKIIQAYNDPELEEKEKCYVALKILYINFENIPEKDMEEAYRKAVWFIDCGEQYTEKTTQELRLMDWEHDESIVIPAINRVAGREVRTAKYIHWWTFIGLYMEIGECVFSEVVYIRQKLAKHERLEKYEKVFYRANKDIIDLPVIKDKEELEEEEFIKNMFG